MDIYTYVASSNPYQAKSILHKYGYSAVGVSTTEDLGVCLKKLVAREGEVALNDVLESHPDKGIIIEKFSVKDEHKNCSGNCKCGEKGYHNFGGNTDTAKTSQSSNQTSVFILAAALMLAAAIIVKN